MTTLEEVQSLHDAFDNGRAIAAFWDNAPEYNATLDAEEVLANFYEAFAGEWDSPVEFAQQLAEDLGVELPSTDAWPLYCIDWDYAAREIMFDYWESDGFYFRSL